jgi:hypothetical protein
MIDKATGACSVKVKLQAELLNPLAIKETEKGQGLFITVQLSEQLVPGTYEHTLNNLVDKKLDLRIFDRQYNNDATGATAIEPRILLKIIL